MTDASAAAAAALDLIVSRNVGAVAGAVQSLELPSPAYALCLWFSDTPGELHPYPISVGVEEDRAAALKAQGPARAPYTVWNPTEYWVSEVLFDLEGLRSSPGYVAAERTVEDSLEKRGVLDPARWVLNEVAQRLSEQPPLAPVTSDFVAFVLDDNFGDELFENLRASAPQHVFEALKAKGLLPKYPSFKHELP